jgi:hypothetical protein
MAIGPTSGYDRARRSGRLGEDVFKRQRVGLHDRSMRMGDMKERLRSGDPNWNNPGGGGFGGGPPTTGQVPAVPTLNVPEYDEDKVSALTQKRAAPGIRKLREATRSAMSETYDNPNVKRMTVRDALAGYGTGLESVMAGAGQAATQEYGQQYAASVNAEMARFSAANSRYAQAFDVGSRAWLMEREYQLKEEYTDPYDAFKNFYNEGKGGGGGGGGGLYLTAMQKSRPARDEAWRKREFR